MTRSLLLPVSIAAGLIGCASRTPGARPNDMSAAGHRKAAEEHRTAARDHLQKYDPAQRKTLAISISNPSDPRLGLAPIEEYNPTATHLGEAEAHAGDASEHERAATELETAEDALCAGISPSSRVHSPLRGNVMRLELIPSGVRLWLRPDLSAAALADEARCHVAHARTRGSSGMGDCPLLLEDVRTTPAAGDRALDLTSPRETLPVLRRRAAALLAPTSR